MQRYLFSPQFSINDTNSDPFQFTYSINSSSSKNSDNNIIYNISYFPSVINGITTLYDYLSVYTTSFYDSPYIINTTITAYTPDNRTSLSIQTIIYIN